MMHWVKRCVVVLPSSINIFFPQFLGGSKENYVYLNALFDPEVAAHGLPVLRAAGVEQPLVHTALHGGIKHLEELCSDERLGAAKS